MPDWQRAGINLLAIVFGQSCCQRYPDLLERAPQPADPPVGLALVRQDREQSRATSARNPRLPGQHYSQLINTAMREAGFAGIRPGDTKVFPLVPPDGISVGDLAARAGVRKQTMGEAVEQLERSGYVERRPNPRDSRSRLVFPTERGRSVEPVARSAGDRADEQWARLTSPAGSPPSTRKACTWPSKNASRGWASALTGRRALLAVAGWSRRWPGPAAAGQTLRTRPRQGW